ncbi:MAG: FkbM family methyltransferase [Hyphomicrobiales bacterium]|nr:FkbM family methyltransferase [Hyphomicrobiales bacterium]
MDDTRQVLSIEGAHAPYGAYAPDAVTRLVVALARHTPLGRGGARTKIRDFLRARCDGPVDGKLFGLPVRCYFDENRCEWKAYLKPSMFDPQERAMVARYIAKANAVFLDIGANIGVHSLAASRVGWPDATILAFEPHPVTYGRLAFNVAQCGHPGVQAVQVALSDRDGFAVLGGADLSLRSLALGGDGPQVRTRPLIDVLDDFGIAHIDAMKIDVEGHEDSVLKHFLDAAPDALVPRLVIIEHLGRHVWSFDCIEALQARGMRVAATAGNNTFLTRD